MLPRFTIFRRFHSTGSVLPNKTIRSLLSSPSSETVTVYGWIRTLRAQKTVSFAEITDGTTSASLQAVLTPDIAKPLSTGACVRLDGRLIPSRGTGQQVELEVNKVQVLGECDSTYPLQKKRHSIEFLREWAHLRPRSRLGGGMMRLRDKAAACFHSYLRGQEFIGVHTPILTSHDCEGGGEVFTALPQQKLVDYEKGNESSFFGAPAYLTVSGQLQAEMLASALSRVYTFGPTFRAEPSLTSRHLSEFWMLEVEIAFINLTQLLDVAEGCVQAVVRDLLTNHSEELRLFEKWVDPSLRARLERTLQPFARITYSEAIDILQKSKGSFEFPVEWGLPLQSEHERYLAESHIEGPVFVTDYPHSLKPFYMRRNSSEDTVACADLLVPKVGELMGGSMREERMDELLASLKDHGLSEAEYSWYLDLRRYGSAPHGGFGIGFERFMMFVTGVDSVRDVIPLPRYSGHCKY
ncbi:uncharacterized protein VTP21DRAFT_7887 [Calcarisporiella thermophila]|uniref:uncharacterized protein n=1 Tax=Calcarisporiella thermophila TaxID=911321 RepID=UPI0037447ADB